MTIVVEAECLAEAPLRPEKSASVSPGFLEVVVAVAPRLVELVILKEYEMLCVAQCRDYQHCAATFATDVAP